MTFSRLHSFKTLFPLCPSVSLYSLCQSLELHLSISGRKFCSSSTQLSFFLGLFLISIYPLPQLKVSFIALILWKVRKCQLLSRVWLFSAPWTVARKAPLSGQESWNGLPFPSPGDLPDPGNRTHVSCMAGRFITAEPPGKPIPPPFLQNICGVLSASVLPFSPALLTASGRDAILKGKCDLEPSLLKKSGH